MKRIALTCMALVLLACGGDDPISPADLAGTYLLATVDGQPLPKTVSVSSGSVTIVRVDAATLQLVADGSTQHFQMDVMMREGNTGTPYPAEVTDIGTFTRNGNALTIEVMGVDRPATFSTVAGVNRITVNVGGGFGTFVFNEQP